MHPSFTNRLATLAACACILPALMAPIPAGAQQFAEDLPPATLNLSPDNPDAFFPDAGQENRLAPSTSMLVIVTIAKTGHAEGHDYQLSGQPEFAPQVDFGIAGQLWTEGPLDDSGNQLIQQYLITNTSPQFTPASLSVSCVWTPVTGYGGGGGPRPDHIYGSGLAQIYLEETIVTWDFERLVAVYNLADHLPEDRQIPFTVSFEDTVGRLLSSDHITNVSFSFADDPPAPQGSGFSGLFVQITENLEQFTNVVRAYIDALDWWKGGRGEPRIRFNDGGDNDNDAEDNVALAPLESAPQVLRVNSDFDQFKIDTETGFAQPDNFDQSLIAAGGENEGSIVIKDLHPGFFGLRPGRVGSDFFEGATVTIEKVDAIDEDFGHEELGHVRIYATKDRGSSGETHTLIHSTDPDENNGQPNPNLVPVAYLDPAEIPPDGGVEYWIEGLHPGPITLKFTYEKGDVSFTHSQQFLVATHQTREDWQEEIRQQILLETGGTVDLAAFAPDTFFAGHNRQVMRAIYEYYAQCHHRSGDVLMWSGLGKLAGAAVYQGAEDANAGGAGGMGGANALNLVRALMLGAKHVSDDIGWQHRAYIASGYWALEHVSETDGRLVFVDQSIVDLTTWEHFHVGHYSDVAASLEVASLEVARREQEYVLSEAFEIIHTLGTSILTPPPGFYATTMSKEATNPIPPGTPEFWAMFSETEGNTNGHWITIFEHRWQWVGSDHEESMLNIWSGLTPAQRLAHSATDFDELRLIHKQGGGE